MMDQHWLHTLPSLANALRHRSALIKNKNLTSNERLEFLGDAVLELIVSEFLYKQFAHLSEGKLTAYRSMLVNTKTLAQTSQEIGLDQIIVLSPNEERAGGRSNPNILADSFEAVIGAIYLDKGYQEAKNFIYRVLTVKLEKLKEEGKDKDHKSQLQELVQGRGLPTPTYQVLDQKGPDHDKIFQIAVIVNNQQVGVGFGKSKQQAEQQAAQQALRKLKPPQPS